MHMICTPIFKGIGAQLFSHGQANIPHIIQLLWWHKQILFLFYDGIIQGPLVLLHYFCWINRAKFSKTDNIPEIIRMNEKKKKEKYHHKTIQTSEICFMAGE